MWAASATGRQKRVGGDEGRANGRMREGGEEEERDEELEAGEKAYWHTVDGSNEYDLFLKWIAVGGGEEKAREEGSCHARP